LGLVNSPECGNCNEADETALHYLCYCSHYGAVRTRIWGKPFLHPSEVPHIAVKDLLRFLTSSRRFLQYPGKEYQGLYWGMDYGPICGLVQRRTTSPPPKQQQQQQQQVRKENIPSAAGLGVSLAPVLVCVSEVSIVDSAALWNFICAFAELAAAAVDPLPRTVTLHYTTQVFSRAAQAND